MGVTLTDVFDTLQVYLGGSYVNDFNQLRPNLAGQHPGRRPLPRERGRRQASSRSAMSTAT